MSLCAPQRMRSLALALAYTGCFAATGIGAEPDDRHHEPVEPAELVGTWTAELDVRGLLALDIELHGRPGTEPRASVSGANRHDTEIPVAVFGDRFRFQPTAFPISVQGRYEDGAVHAFVHHGQAVFHLRLKPADAESTWRARWSLSGGPEEVSSLDLYVLEEDEGQYAAYLFFRDPRMPSLWTYGLECADGSVRFYEKNLGLAFEGSFERTSDAMALTASALGGTAPVSFRRLTTQVMRHSERFLPAGDLAAALQPRVTESTFRDEAPAARNDGWQTATPSSHGLDVARIGALVRAIERQELTLTDGVLIARHGKLVVEEYFYGFNADMRHDMRSASKTIAAALVGVGIDNGTLPGVDAPVLHFFPHYRHLAHWDVRKARITLHHLLTMASGLDANDSDPNSVASENTYQSQSAQPDWMRLVLDAPMIHDPGAQPLYGSGNPLLVGGVLHAAVDGAVEVFAHEHLFSPLQVEAYKWFLDPTGKVYMGGGMHLRPRDMLKFGQLHLDGGIWDGKRIVSEDWVRRSMAKYGRLGNARDKNAYGYLWWHRDYEVNNRTLASIEARGAGGQYIFVVPALDLVAVVTSGNYRNGRFRQPEEIMERYVLPAVRQDAAQR